MVSCHVIKLIMACQVAVIGKYRTISEVMYMGCLIVKADISVSTTSRVKPPHSRKLVSCLITTTPLRLGDGKRSLNCGDWEVYAMVIKKKFFVNSI